MGFEAGTEPEAPLFQREARVIHTRMICALRRARMAGHMEHEGILHLYRDGGSLFVKLHLLIVSIWFKYSFHWKSND